MNEIATPQMIVFGLQIPSIRKLENISTSPKQKGQRTEGYLNIGPTRYALQNICKTLHCKNSALHCIAKLCSAVASAHMSSLEMSVVLTWFCVQLCCTTLQLWFLFSHLLGYMTSSMHSGNYYSLFPFLSQFKIKRALAKSFMLQPFLNEQANCSFQIVTFSRYCTTFPKFPKVLLLMLEQTCQFSINSFSSSCDNC